MELVPLLHKWLEGLSLNVAITLDLRDAIAVIYLTISTYGYATKPTVAPNQIGRVALHKVIILGIGGYGAFYILDSLEE